MQFWDTIKNWANQNTDRYIYHHIPDPAANVEVLSANKHYFRVWLVDMYLVEQRRWFTQWYPAVQASIKLEFGDRDPQIFSRITRPESDKAGRGIFKNYKLSELVPYRGGTVEIEAALLGFQGLSGTDYIGAALGLLERFSSLVTTPLGQALKVAKSVNDGIDDLIKAANGEVRLSLHDTFATSGSNALRPGYLAVIYATRNEITNPEQLTVNNDILHHNNTPLEKYDYFLLKIESISERDDWESFSYIDELRNKVASAYELAKPDQAETFTQALKYAIYDSEDFTRSDKQRILSALKEELDILKEIFTPVRGFTDIVISADEVVDVMRGEDIAELIQEAAIDSDLDTAVAFSADFDEIPYRKAFKEIITDIDMLASNEAITDEELLDIF